MNTALESMDPKSWQVGEDHFMMVPKGRVVVGAEGLSVKLRNYTTDQDMMKAVYPMVAATWGYSENRAADATPERIAEVYEQALAGKVLPAAGRVGSFTFEIAGVSRNATHQLVRHGNVNIGQNSSRCNDYRNRDLRILPSLHPNNLDFQERIRKLYAETLDLYADLVDNGYQYQDASRILPTGTVTTISLEMDALTLQGIYKQRGCLDMDPETNLIARLMKAEVERVCPILGKWLKISCEFSGKCTLRDNLQEPCQKIFSDDRPRSEYKFIKETNASLLL